MQKLLPGVKCVNNLYFFIQNTGFCKNYHEKDNSGCWNVIKTLQFGGFKRPSTYICVFRLFYRSVHLERIFGMHRIVGGVGVNPVATADVVWRGFGGRGRKSRRRLLRGIKVLTHEKLYISNKRVTNRYNNISFVII